MDAWQMQNQIPSTRKVEVISQISWTKAGNNNKPHLDIQMSLIHFILGLAAIAITIAIVVLLVDVGDLHHQALRVRQLLLDKVHISTQCPVVEVVSVAMEEVRLLGRDGEEGAGELVNLAPQPVEWPAVRVEEAPAW